MSWLLRFLRSIPFISFLYSHYEQRNHQRLKRLAEKRFRSFLVEPLEERVLLTADLNYQATNDGDLLLRHFEGDIQLVDVGDPNIVFASESLSNITGGVLIDGGGFDVNLTLDSSLVDIPGGIEFDAGAGTNILKGPAINSNWEITGDHAGTLNGQVSFSGVENLIGAGDDTYRFSGTAAGTFLIDETAGGVDTLDFSARNSAVKIDLASQDEQAIDTSSNLKLAFSAANVVENVVGSSHADEITGNELDNTITGGAGADTLAGGDGDDTYLFANGWGVDVITEAAGFDSGGGEDTLDFSTVTADLTVVVDADGKLTVSDGSGNTVTADHVERLIGGSGLNSIDFSAYESEISVDLELETATLFTSLINFSNVIGTDYDDVIIGNDNANILSGGKGEDFISGRAGDDTLDGGDDSDTLVEARDVNFTLTNISLTATGIGITGTENNQLSGFETAFLTGGAHANILDAQGFTGDATLDGGSVVLLSALNAGTGVRTNDGQLNDLTGVEGVTPLSVLNNGDGVRSVAGNDFRIILTDGLQVDVDIDSGMTLQGVLDAVIAAAPVDRLTAALSQNGSAIEITDANPGSPRVNPVIEVVALPGSFAAEDLGLLGKGGPEVLGGTGISDVSSDFAVTLTNGKRIDIDISEAASVQDLLDTLNLADDDLFASINAGGTGIDLHDTAGGGGNLTVEARNGSFAAPDLGILGAGTGGTLQGLSIIDGDVRLDGRLDNDTLKGGDGNDRLTGGGGLDAFDGGTGVNTLVETRDADFTLTSTSLLIGTDAADTLENIQRAELTGGAGNNTINAAGFTVGDVVLDGGDGDDNLTGGTGDDLLTGGGGKDILDGADGMDTVVEREDTRFIVVGDTTSATLDMAEGDDEVVTLSLASGVTGGTFTLTFDGQTTDAIPFDANAPSLKSALTALSNIDPNDVQVEQTISGGPWVITFFGNKAGKDQPDMVASSAGLVGGAITAAITPGADANNFLNQLMSIEKAILTGGLGGNLMDASQFSGAVELYGAGGDDSLLGGSGIDLLDGGADNDTITGKEGTDVLRGGEGIDVLVETRDANFTLTNTSLTTTGVGITGSEVDAISGFERARLTGGASANIITTSLFTGLTGETELSLLNGGQGVRTTFGVTAVLTGLESTTPLSTLNNGAGVGTVPGNDFDVLLTDGSHVLVDVGTTMTVKDLFNTIAAASAGKLTATLESSGTAILLTDTAGGGGNLQVTAVGASTAAEDLGILGAGTSATLLGSSITDGSSDLVITLADNTKVGVDLTGLTTIQGVLDAIGELSPNLTAALNTQQTAIVITDTSVGGGNLRVAAANGSSAAEDLGILAPNNTGSALTGTSIAAAVVVLDGRGDADILTAGTGNDTLRGGTGNDTLDGGGGTDTVEEFDEGRDSDITLTLIQLSFATTIPETDSLLNIERASLHGGASNNVIDASTFSGSVNLFTGGGLDTLKGGLSNDRFEIDVSGLTAPDKVTVDVGGGTENEVVIVGEADGPVTQQSLNWVSFSAGQTADYRIERDQLITVAEVLSRPGQNIILEARTINVTSEINTQDVNAGNITLEGRHITVGQGGKLLAKSTLASGGTDGTIDILAIDDRAKFNFFGAGEASGGFLGFANLDTSKADINIDGATIQGGDVRILTSTDTEHVLKPSDFGSGGDSAAASVGALGVEALDRVLTNLMNTSLFVAVTQAKSISKINIGSTTSTPTVIDANNFTAWSTAKGFASAAPSSPILFSLAIGLLETDANVTIGNAEIMTSGDATIRTSVDNKLNVTSNGPTSVLPFGLAGGGSNNAMTGKQKFLSTAATGGLAFAFSKLDSNSIVNIEDDAVLTIGQDLFAQSDTIDRNNTIAGMNTKPKQLDGFFDKHIAKQLGPKATDVVRRSNDNKSAYGISVALAFEDGVTNAWLDGSVDVGGVANVTAMQTNDDVEIVFFKDSGVVAATNVGSNIGNNFKSLKKSLDSYYNSPKNEDGSAAKKVSFQGGVAVAIMEDTNSVEARIGDGVNQRNVRSDGGVNVTSKIEARPDITAQSKLLGRKTELAASDTAGASKAQNVSNLVSKINKPGTLKRKEKQIDNGAGIAVAVGIYENNADAYISSDARVDSAGAITIKAEALNEIDPLGLFGANLVAPFLAENLEPTFNSTQGTQTLNSGDTVEVRDGHTGEGVVGSVYTYIGPENNSIDLVAENYTDGTKWEFVDLNYNAGLSFIRTYGAYADGNMGLDNNLIDSWSQVSASGFKKAAYGAAVTVLDLEHNVNATIKDGARINQDMAYFTSLGATPQDVDVEARSVVHMINMGGSFQKDGISKFRGLQEKFDRNTTGRVAGKFLGFNPYENVPIETKGKGAKRALGVTIAAYFYENHVSATIEDGVILTADKLTVDADNKVLGVALGAALGKAQNFGFTGAGIFSSIDNETIASVGGTAVVTTAGDAFIDATDTSYLITVAGAIIKSEKSGVGASVALNDVSRNTQAYIGNSSDDLAYVPGGLFTAGGKIDVTSLNDGFLGVFAVAGAKASNETASTDDKQTTALGAAVGFARNEVRDATKAFVHHATINATGNVALRATSESVVEAFSIGGALAQGNVNSVALAGAGSVNSVNNSTEAFIKASNDASNSRHVVSDTGTISVSANDATQVYSQAGAVSVAWGKKELNETSTRALSIGASVAINEIGDDEGNFVRAFIRDSTVTAHGDIDVTATASGKVHALAIGGSVSVGAGGTVSGTSLAGAAAGAFASNGVASTIESYVGSNSTVTANNAGGVTLSAKDLTELLRADAFGIAVAYASSQRTGATTGALSIGVGIGRNKVKNSIQTRIENSKVDAVGDIDLTAESQADVSALGIGVAASVARGTGSTGAIAGAGSAATNEIDNQIAAYITGSGGTKHVESSAGSIILTATDDVDVVGVAGTVALALGLKSSGSGLNAAVAAGVAVVLNDVGLDGGQFTKTYIDNSIVTAFNDVTMTALSTSSIYALAAGGAGAVAGGKGGSGATGAFAGAGVATENEVKQTIASYITNRGVVTASNGAATITATDSTEITADAGAVAVALAVASTPGTAISGSVGVAIALNTVENDVWAYVDDSTLTAQSVAITAESKKDPTSSSDFRIDALAFGVSAALSGSNKQGLTGAFAGAGSGARNEIDNSILAYVTDSNGAAAGLATTVTTTQGALAISATDDASIRSDTGGFAIAASLGKGASGDVSLGVSVSLNDIGTGRGHSVLAYADNSSLTSAGPLSISSSSTANIKALALAGSVSIAGSSGSGLAGALAGAGVGTVNTIEMDIHSKVTGGSTIIANSGGVGLPGDISLTATDGSKIKADAIAGAISLAGSTQGSGGAIAVGVSVALNHVANSVLAEVAASSVTTSQGNVMVTASESPTAEINATTVAASVSIAAAKNTGVAISGGGAGSVNSVSNTVNARITGSSITATAGNVTLDSRSNSSIDSDVVAAALGFGAGSSNGVAGAIGASVAKNYVGYDEDGNAQTSQIQAYFEDSAITVGGALSATATGASNIESTVVAVSVALAGGRSNALGLAGSGVSSENKIATDVKAYIDGDGVTGITAGSVSLSASDSSRIDADAGAASLAAAVSGSNAASISIGIALAENEVKNDVAAYILDADNIRSTGNITVQSRVLSAPIDTATYTSSSSTQTLTEGDTVELAANYANGGKVGRIYRYRGFVADYTSQTDFDSIDGEQSVVTGNTVKNQVDGAIYFYVGDDDANLDLSTTDYDDDDLWEIADLGLHEGNTVQVGNDVYRYNGEDDDINFGTVNFGSAPWQLVNPDVRNLGITDYSDTRLWELADGTITTRSVAASLAAGFGRDTGVALSGAGATSTNTILTKSNAFISNSTIVNAANVDLDAENSSAITATVAALSVAIGAGGQTGVGASIGVSIAENNIGWDNDTRTPAEVQAYIMNSSVDASGSLTLDTMASETIDAVVLAGSAAIAGGQTTGVALSGAGVSATNRVASLVKSFIDGDDDDSAAAVSGITAGNVGLNAKDTSSIDAIAGAASIAASYGGTTGVALSVGVALANNHISNEVEAYIANADDTLTTTTGDVVIDAQTVAAIDAITAAASIAIGGGGTAGIAVSGAGAVAKNVILTRTNAFVREDSVIDSAGKVDIDAMSDSAIDATVVAVSAAVGIGGTAGIGASVGFALARNFIGWDPSAPASDYDTTQDQQTLLPGKRVKVLEGVRAGDVYRYIGDTVNNWDFTNTGTHTLQNDDDKQTRVKVGDDIYVWEGDDNQSVNLGTQNYQTNGDFDDDGNPEPSDDWRLQRVSRLAGEDFGDVDRWKLILPQDIEDASQVQAYVTDADIKAVGNLSLDAESKGTVDAFTLAGSVAIGGGGTVGVALSGAGVGVENRLRTLVKSYIDDASLIEAQDILLTSRDTSNITADAAAASIAGSAAGTVGVSVSVGVAVAYNEVSNVVESSINDSASVTARGNIVIDSRTLGGDIPNPDFETTDGQQTLTAGQTVLIADDYPLNTVANFSSSDGTRSIVTGQTVRLSAGYTIGGTPGGLYVFVGDSGSVDLSDEDYSDEDDWAEIGGLEGRIYRYRGFAADFSSTAGTTAEPEQELDNGDTVRVARGHASGGTIGGVYQWKGGDETDVDLRVENYGNTSRWTPITPDARNLSKEDYTDSKSWELADGTITARVGAASLAASFGGVFGGAISGAGAVATNVILTKTNAYIANSNIVEAVDVDLDAKNNSVIVATVAALSAAIGGGGAVGAGVSIGASTSRNYIGYNQEGDKQAAEVQAYIVDSSVNATGDLTLNAMADEKIDAIVLAGSAAIAGGGAAGVAASGAGVSATNRIGNDVKAFIDGDDPGSDDTGRMGISATTITLSADDTSAINAVGGAASIAASFGGGGAASLSVGVALAENTIDNVVQASISNADNLEARAGDVILTATESNSIVAETVAASAAIAIAPASIAISGGAASALNTINSTTAAFIDASEVTAKKGIKVAASDTATIDAEIKAISAAGGVISVAVGLGLANNEAANTVQSYIQDSSVTASGGNIEVSAISDPAIFTRTEATALSVGFGVGAAGANSQTVIEVTTEAYVQGATLTADGNDVLVHATSMSTAAPVTKGNSGGAVAVSLLNSKATISGSTLAYVGGTGSVSANKLDVQAKDTNTAQPTTSVAAAGAITVSVATTDIELKRTTEALIKSGTDLTMASGDLVVKAESDSQSQGAMASSGIGAITLGFLTVKSSIDSTTRAAIESGASVSAAGGNVDVHAVTVNRADARTSSFSIGAVTFDKSDPTAKITATTEALALGDITGPNGAPGAINVRVNAEGDDRTTAGARSLAIGLVSIGSSTVIAQTAPTVTARGGGTIRAGQNVEFMSKSVGDADAASETTSGGAVAVTNLDASATAVTNVTTEILPDMIIDAGGDIRISSNHGEPPSPTADGTFDAGTDVDLNANTIDLGLKHGLLNGDTVTYFANGGGVIGGLENPLDTGDEEIGRTYGVIRTSDTTIQLGTTFQSSAVNIDRDELKFTAAHNLKTGDRVVYQADGGAEVGGLTNEGLYQVLVIDSTTIKLNAVPDPTQPLILPSPQEFSGAKITGNSINIDGHGFDDGDAVTYRATDALDFGVLSVDVKGAEAVDPELPTDDDSSNDNIFLGPNHGLTSGDEVIYSAASGTPIPELTSGTRYFVILDPLKPNEIQLASSLANALGDPGATPDPIPPSPIPISRSGNAADESIQLSLLKVVDQPIGGLNDGVTYYIDKIDADNFQLTTDAAGSNFVAVDKFDPGPGPGTGTTVLTGTSTLRTESEDLDNAGSGTHHLVLDLRGGGSGSQLLDGVGGARALAAAPSGDGIVTASASGSGGGIVRSSNAVTSASNTPTVTTTIGNSASLGGNDISVTALSIGNASASSANSGGGLVSIGDAESNLTVSGTGHVDIGSATLIASNNITVRSNTNVDGSVLASSNGGGLVDIADADVSADIIYDSQVDIGANADLNAGNTVTVESVSETNVAATALGDSAGLGSSAGTEAFLTIGDSDSARAVTKTSLGESARLQGGNAVIVSSKVMSLAANSRAEAESGGAIAGAEALARIDIFDSVTVDLATNAALTAETVTISADHLGVDLKSRSDADTDGLYADATSEARAHYDSLNEVNTASGVTVAAGELSVTSKQTVSQFYRRATADVDVLGDETTSTPRRFQTESFDRLEW